MTYEQEKELELQKKVIPQNMKPDFKEFWEEGVKQLRKVPIQMKRKVMETPYDKTFITYEISYNTHDDTWIDAWFSVPANAKGKLPCVVFYHGGNGRRLIWPEFPATGVCCFAMDVRGQGGALSIVASALSGHSKKCYTQITSYCALRNRTELGSGILKGAYDYLKRFPQDATTVFDVLSYFDIINMVSLLKVPTDFFMGLADPICFPHFVYSAYAHANCEKTITMYPFTPHEVPHTYRRVVQTELLKLL